jgi:hypothetical protein
MFIFTMKKIITNHANPRYQRSIKNSHKNSMS